MYATYREYVRDRNEAFINLDLDWMQDQLKVGRDLALVALHKLRYECEGVPNRYRVESALWLRSNGYRRLNGEPVIVGRYWDGEVKPGNGTEAHAPRSGEQRGGAEVDGAG